MWCITKCSEIYAASEGGLRGVDHEMFRDLLAVISMHISESQSRTFPLYITFWQLHSLLYLEKSQDIWDSVVSLPAVVVRAPVPSAALGGVVVGCSGDGSGGGDPL